MGIPASPSPFFVKDVGAVNAYRADEREKAVTNLAAMAHGSEDFELLADALGLNDAVEALRGQRRAA